MARELEKIEVVNINSLRLQTVRDLFVFSCYTGISYADLMLLNKESLVLGMESYWIITNRQDRKPRKSTVVK